MNMRPSDHFYSELDAAARRNRDSLEVALESAVLSFSRLIAPTVGGDVAEALFDWWRERYGSMDKPQWEKLGHIAAFVLGDYDDRSMDLDRDDWEAIRDVLSDAADELDLSVLSRLMADLVSHGALD
jgi:hypothetical protein